MKTSDIDTLHLFASTITTILRTVDEREIFENCFEILNAFDEIITLGYKEPLNLSQIVTFLEMESHEEKIQEIIERNKELEATEQRKRKAKEIQRKEMMRKNMESFEFQQQQNFVSPSYQQQTVVQPSAYTVPEPETTTSPQQARFAGAGRKGGLQLGKKSSRLGASGEGAQPLLISTPAPARRSLQAQRDNTPSTPTKPKITNNGILITINEKFAAQISREGAISQAEIKGDLQLRINDPQLAMSKINLQLNKSSDITTQYKTHPNMEVRS
ncbi:unnamed protein product [Ambrosiozyma monospora]|uniref:Coatomer subunit delta n=1 Tax=Ambrosiozyma monospora TaxID=43982 RepID=A0A9W6T3X8_AMBMO|nr:unnamed protein product [Ambrosiozyma monospora]